MNEEKRTKISGYSSSCDIPFIGNYLFCYIRFAFTVFFVRCRGVQTDLQMFCICLFFIGVLFFFANHIWHVDFYKDYFEIHRLIFRRKVSASDVKKLFITDTHKIQIWNEKKKVASIDINCINYKR